MVGHRIASRLEAACTMLRVHRKRVREVALRGGTLLEQLASRRNARRAFIHLREVYKEFCTQRDGLRSPRVNTTQASLAGGKFWRHIRENPDDGAYMQFFGVPVFLFKHIAARMKPLVPHKYDPARKFSHEVDYFDLTAFSLRRLQIISVDKDMCRDFGINWATLSRHLEVGKMYLQPVIRSFHEARVVYPSLDEAQEQLKGLIAQHGPPPEKWKAEAHPPVLFVDGMFTPRKKCGDLEQQEAFQSGLHGPGSNNLLMNDISGTYVDAAIGGTGTINDGRMNRQMFERHQSPEINPHRLGLVADTAFRHKRRFVGDGAPVWTTLKDGEKIFAGWTKKEFLHHASYVPKARSSNENMNGGLQKSFPRVHKKVSIAHHAEAVDDLATCMMLFNLRTRVVGFNQLRTMFMRHVDMNFREQLERGQGKGGLARYMELAEARWAAAMNNDVCDEPMEFELDEN